jgi:hypothetical protein
MPRGRLRAASASAAAMPIATAGAGPSTAIASTIPRNDPPIRKRFASSTMKSLPRISTASRPTSAPGRHCSSVESSAAATTTATSSTPCPIATACRRLSLSTGSGRGERACSPRDCASSAAPAARISARDQPTMTTHSATASQTITPSR